MSADPKDLTLTLSADPKGSDTDFVSGSKGSDTDFVSGSKGSKLPKSFIREQKFQTNKSQNTESLCSYSWLNSTIESISYPRKKLSSDFYYLVMVQAKLVPIITVEVVKGDSIYNSLIFLKNNGTVEESE